MDRIKSGKYRKWNISRMTLMVGVGAAVVLARAALGSDRWCRQCRYGVDMVQIVLLDWRLYVITLTIMIDFTGRPGHGDKICRSIVAPCGQRVKQSPSDFYEICDTDILSLLILSIVYRCDNVGGYRLSVDTGCWWWCSPWPRQSHLYANNQV